jgi:hypothetical protein
MSSLIIGFGGPAEHGKSTSANIAEKWFLSHGFTVKVISFADRLKEVCKIMFRLTDKDLNSTIGKATYRNHLKTTPRVVMQKFGTEVCREGISRHLPAFTEHGGTIWTWNVERDILDCSADVILIPDVRFHDELDMLRKFECILINVVRPSSHASDPSSHASDPSSHASEVGLPDPDYVLMNDGTLADLERKLVNVLKNTYPVAEAPTCSSSLSSY